MPKTVNNVIREMFYSIINKYNEVKSERDTVFNGKVQLSTLILKVTDECIKDPMKIETIRSSIDKLRDLEGRDIWKKCTDHVINVENIYKQKDRILEDKLNPFIINVRSENADDSDDSFSGIEFLESDFDYDS